MIPDDKSQVSMFSELGDKLTEQVLWSTGYLILTLGVLQGARIIAR